MKAYCIYPAFELRKRVDPDDRDEAAIALIARLAFDCLRRGGDIFQYTVDWRDPGAPPERAGFTADIAEPHIVRLSSDAALLDRIRRSVDPNGDSGGTIRSIATCRAVTFGWDGQAFLCLRHEDEPPVSPDPALAIVSESPDLLVATDYFDGWMRD